MALCGELMRLEFTLIPDWPPLAWLARCHRSGDVLKVYHGRGIELTDEWFCEAVWAGQYQEGGFDETDVIAGSGGRLRNGNVNFVSSGSTVDRLSSLEVEDGVWVSNSLPCLLAALNGSVDPSYPFYFENFETIIHGIDQYERFLSTSIGRIRLTYFDNLVWDGRTLKVEPKPGEHYDFSNFSRYRSFLETSLQKLAENITAPERKHPYRFLGTLSSGYDSATVSTLAKQVGCDQVISFDRSKRDEDDSGEAVAKIIGVAPLVIQRSAWSSMALPEVPFLVADGNGEDVHYKSAETVLAGRVLLTGFNGGVIWGKEIEKLGPNIVRKDNSGLTLTEYRLKVNFINCPLPFWGGRQIREVNRISNSPEMAPWDVPGDYSRPICRRIVEEAGVPRELFGTKKKATSHGFAKAKSSLTPSSVEDYLEWLKSVRLAWVKHGRIPPVTSLEFDHLVGSTLKRMNNLSWHRRPVLWRVSKMIKKKYPFKYPIYLSRYFFPWAIEHAKKSYCRPF